MIAGLHTVASTKVGQPKRWYIYAWRGGPRIGLRIGGPKPMRLTPTEVNAYHSARAAADVRPKNTLAALVRDYRVSPEWAGLARTTKTRWGPILGLIEDRWGDVPLDVISDRRMAGKIIAWRDEKAAHPRTADYHIGVLRSLLGWGLIRGRVTSNPAKGIPTLYKGGNRAKILWASEDVDLFVSRTPQHVGDIIRLASVTGFRAADLAELEWGEVLKNAIVRQAKKVSRGTPRNAVVPLVFGAKELLNELRNRPRAEGVNTVLVNSYGKAWSAAGLSGTISTNIKELGIRHHDGRLKHLHDVRGTFATALFDAGLSDEQAAEILAWSPSQVVSIRAHYVDREQRIVALAATLNGSRVKPVVKSGSAQESESQISAALRV